VTTQLLFGFRCSWMVWESPRASHQQTWEFCEPLQPSCGSDDEHVLILRGLFHFPQLLWTVLWGILTEINNTRVITSGITPARVWSSLFESTSFLLSFFTKLGSFQESDLAAALLRLFQAVLCCLWTEMKDNLTQSMTTLSLGLQRSLSALENISAVIFHKVVLLLVCWTASCVFESYWLLPRLLGVFVSLAECLLPYYAFVVTGSVRFESARAWLICR
jgi:hypothetical protein